MLPRIELVSTPSIALHKIVRMSLLSCRGSNCSARGGLAAEGTWPKTKTRKIEQPRSPNRKNLRKTWEIFLSLFFLFVPGPPTKKVPVEAIS